MQQLTHEERRLGWATWAVIVVLLVSLGLFLPGCSAQQPRCTVQGENVQRVGESATGDYVQIRAFVELCRAGI